MPYLLARATVLTAVTLLVSFTGYASGATAVPATTLDMFRFADGVVGLDPSTPSEFTSFSRNLVPGQAAIFDDLTNEYQMSTGRAPSLYPGVDGNQASHWKADEITAVNIGIMDPTISFGTATPVKASDIRALDLIGYEAGAGSTTGTMTFNVNYTGGFTGNTAAQTAFSKAILQWTNVLHDSITVNITANLTSTGFSSPLQIGGATPYLLMAPYNTVGGAMYSDSLDEGADDAIVGYLPAGPTFLLPSGYVFNNELLLTKANAKALGFTGLDETFGLLDANLTFNSGFAFDFDASDGIGSGLIDFETVVAHELGHALGFLSIVDEINAVPEPGSLAVLLMAGVATLTRRRRVA
jgi:hypothetical protein